LEHSVALAERDAGRAVSELEAVTAVRVIAARLRASTLRPHEYAAERAVIESRAGHTDLPTADRVAATLQTETEVG
jgi:hypothetical protein